MKTIAITGKVDSRIIAYPLARALSIQGKTCIIAEDGAYNRLYHGNSSTGTVNGIDISVGNRVDTELMESLAGTGTKYDYRIVVSSTFIPTDASGVIICTGVDKSMTSDTQEEIEASEADAATEKPTKAGVGLRGKKRGNSDTPETDNVEDEANADAEKKAAVPKAEVKKDNLVAPSGMKSVNCIISFEAPDRKGNTSISLKDAAIKYLFSCEECKRLYIIDDKSINKLIAGLAADILGLPTEELFKLLIRDEYIKGGKVK